MWTVHTLRLALSASFGPEIELISPSVLSDPCQQISQPISREHHPSISNPARINDVARRKHMSRRYRRAVPDSSPRVSNVSPVAISDLRRNLEVVFCPRLKSCTRKFGKLAPLKSLAISE